MGKPTGFMEYPRQAPPKRSVGERVRDYKEIEEKLSLEDLQLQAARCMDCGVPFCHALGCPVHNVIPDFNDLVYSGDWERALEVLHSTNNLPEITGRVCPAICEPACTLAINAEPVTIRQIELQIVERGWDEGWIQPRPPQSGTGKKIAIVGSGPAALAACQQLARTGHEVIVFERSADIGGILRYGIPDFKIEKWVLDRRLEQMHAEGVVFETNVEVGVDISASYLRRNFDALCLAVGAGHARDLEVPGREGCDGVHFAMQFLTQQNRRIGGEVIPEGEAITAAGKDVVVVGGGDTGADCVGTARRQGARTITQIELLPEPPHERPQNNPWPEWPFVLRTGSSHEEGCDRMWSILTKEVLSEDGRVTGLRCVELEWSEPDQNGRRSFREVPGSEFEQPADLVLLAMGFVHVEHSPLVEELHLELDERGNIAVDDKHMTSVDGVFAAGDCVTGASLVVRAINWGREMAEGVNKFLRQA